MPVTLADVAEYTDFYYKDPQPRHVEDSLRFASSPEYQRSASVPLMAGAFFFFVRAAANDSDLIPLYRKVRDESEPSSRLFCDLLLEVLDEKAENSRFGLEPREQLTNAEAADLVAHLQSTSTASNKVADLREFLTCLADIRVHPLQRPIHSGSDLDLLWAEFCVSGEVEPVRRIITVLSWPDRIRMRLEEYAVHRPSIGPLRRWSRDRAVRALCEPCFIEVDIERGVISPQDDLGWVVAESVGMQSARGPLSREPFHCSTSELLEIATKVAARWSLVSNASQHSLVLKTCEEKIQISSDGLKLALLDITTSVRLGRGEVTEQVLSGLEACVNQDPTNHRFKDRLSQARLLKQSPGSLPIGSDGPNCGEA